MRHPGTKSPGAEASGVGIGKSATAKLAPLGSFRKLRELLLLVRLVVGRPHWLVRPAHRTMLARLFRRVVLGGAR